MENKELLSGGQAELSSSGFGDSLETGWDLKPYIAKNGWNELFLPVKDAVKTGGDTDFAAVNFFRVYLTYTGTMKTGLMDPTLCLEKVEEEPTVYGTKLAIEAGTSIDQFGCLPAPRSRRAVDRKTGLISVPKRQTSRCMPELSLRRWICAIM